jgi:flagellar basal body-associated protein FliL
MNKLVMAGVIVLALAIGAGGMFGVMHFLSTSAAAHAHETAKSDAHAHPKAIYFAELPDIVVSIPPQTGADATSYVQISLQFSTHDPRAVDSFNALLPIIKSQVISLLMNETGATLQNPAARAELLQNSLNAANAVLVKNADDTNGKPFDAAYVTNFVVQD